MFYNLHNLFDTVNDPIIMDGNYTPEGREKWTKLVLSDKIANLNRVILSEAPDIIGLCEVESQEVLEEMVSSGLKQRGYKYFYAGPSKDRRGIRNAVISKFPIVEKKSHQVWRTSWKIPGQAQTVTRDILEVTFDTGLSGPAGDFTVLVNHWPSRLSGDVAIMRRTDAAETMTKISHDIAKRNPGRRIISMGDFNDDVTDKSLKTGTRLLTNPSDLRRYKAGTFYSPELKLSLEERASYYYKRKRAWYSLDHMFISGGSNLNAGTTKGFHYRSGSFRIIRHKFSKEGTYPVGCNAGSPERKLDPTRCFEGASDHWPIVAELQYR